MCRSEIAGIGRPKQEKALEASMGMHSEIATGKRKCCLSILVEIYDVLS